MWFDFNGKYVNFMHTTYRVKFRNLRLGNPSMSVLIVIRTTRCATSSRAASS